MMAVKKTKLIESTTNMGVLLLCNEGGQLEINPLKFYFSAVRKLEHEETSDLD